jgi:hypothetical protein
MRLVRALVRLGGGGEVGLQGSASGRGGEEGVAGGGDIFPTETCKKHLENVRATLHCARPHKRRRASASPEFVAWCHHVATSRHVGLVKEAGTRAFFAHMRNPTCAPTLTSLLPHVTLIDDFRRLPAPGETRPGVAVPLTRHALNPPPPLPITLGSSMLRLIF